MIACDYGLVDIAKLLLDHGADVNLASYVSFAWLLFFLHFCVYPPHSSCNCRKGRQPYVRCQRRIISSWWLYCWTVALRSTNPTGLGAAIHPSVYIYCRLRVYTLTVCFSNAQEGCTPLMWCSQEGLTMAVMLLLERGADPKRQLHVVSIVWSIYFRRWL